MCSRCVIVVLISGNILNKAEICIDLLRSAEFKVAFAESCTGGLLSYLIAAISGASDVLERAFVVYSNRAKVELLGVGESTIFEFGAVSQQVALEMVTGLMSHVGIVKTIGFSVTGIADPTGRTSTKPVGLVYIGCAINGQYQVLKHNANAGNRRSNQLCIAEFVLDTMINIFST